MLRINDIHGIIGLAKTREYCGIIVSRTLGAVYACLGGPSQLTVSRVFYMKGPPTS